MSTASEKLLVQHDGLVKTIIFNQPKKKNAVSVEMSQALLAEIERTAEDDSKVIILTGAGDDFCAGADLDPSLIAGGGGFNVTEFLRSTYNTLVLKMRSIDKPFIARVKGNAVGVGFNFALACDLVIAGENAKFSQIFTRIGLSSDGGGSYFLWEKLGHHRAFELLALGDMVPAEEAHRLGLINRVVPEAELDATVADYARRLSEGPGLAIAHTKANLRAAANEGLAAALEAEAVHQGKNFVSKDFFEGISAFLQKRKANFQGK